MDTQTFSIVMTVVIAHFLALISPGPDFLMMVRSALRNSRRRAIGMALGIALANGIYIVLCIIGVGAAVAHSLWLMTLLKTAGGAFLLYVAWHALKARRSDYAFITAQAAGEIGSRAPSFAKEFLLGLLSGLSNPKNIIFYLSLFSVVLTPQAGMGVTVALGIWMTLLVFVWNAMIALVLSRNSIRGVFARAAFYIDKAAGLLLGVMGGKLLHSAVKES